MATVAELIVQRLRDAGVRTLFGVPGGGSNLDLIAAAQGVGLPFVLTSTETAGAIAAIAQAEITGAPAACLTTLGPGAASVVNGVACAYLERAPLVVFTDSQSTPGGFAHQRIDHRALMAPITKWSESLTADNALDAVSRALHAATDGQPGPVHLDCPGDVAAASAATAGAGTDARFVTSDTDRSRLETLFAAARKPLLIAGLGVRPGSDRGQTRVRPGSEQGQTGVRPGSDDFRRVVRLPDLCSRHRLPAMVTYKAKGTIPDDHAWFAGVFTNAAIEQPLIDDSDLLIGIGLDPVELIPRRWKRTQPIVYLGPWRVDNIHVPFEVQAIGDLDAHLALLDDLLAPTGWDASIVAGHRQRQHDEIARRTDEGFTAQRVIETAARTLSNAAAHVTVDAGAHMFPATVLWPVCRPHQMLISNGLSTMGFALPAAVGAALLTGTMPVVALTGDGGLLMCAGELLTAARERLQIITIVFNDGSLSLIEMKQQARHLPAAGVALGDVDWGGIARGFGVHAARATNASELERTIRQALEHAGPTLIDAKIDRTNYGATLRAVRG